jgi:hypothetical protein
VRVPDEAGLGIAKMTMSFDNWQEGKVAPTTVEIPVVQMKAENRVKPDGAGLYVLILVAVAVLTFATARRIAGALGGNAGKIS